MTTKPWKEDYILIINWPNMLDRNLHRTILLQILKDIYSDSSLGPLMGFKGGTAAHFFYGLDRFSVDLDFDLLREDKELYVFEKLGEILPEYGTLREKRRKKHTIIFVLSYEEKAPNIKVEVNLRNFGSRYELKSYLGISMLVMAKEDMFAHKLVALLERSRTANRDIYDIWYFLKSRWPIKKEIVEMRAKTNFRDHLEKCITFIESISDRRILSGIGDLLDAKQKGWVKNNLRKDTIFLLKLRLEQENQR